MASLACAMPSLDARNNHFALELGEDAEYAEHAKHGSARRCRGVDGLHVNVQPGTGVADRLQNLDMVRQRASKPVAAPDGD